MYFGIIVPLCLSYSNVQFELSLISHLFYFLRLEDAIKIFTTLEKRFLRHLNGFINDILKHHTTTAVFDDNSSPDNSANLTCGYEIRAKTSGNTKLKQVQKQIHPAKI